MNNKIALCIALMLLPALAHSATIQRIAFNGQLDDNGLLINADYDNATFSGYFEFDLDNYQVSSFGSDTQYTLTDWNISFNSSSGGTLINSASGEALDGGTLTLDRSDDTVIIFIHEDIDNPNTGALEDRSLCLYFNTAYNINYLTQFADVVNGDPNLGDASTFEVGSLQFTTSQIPTGVANASFSPSPIPVPAAAWLFASAMLGLFGLKSRQ